MATSLHTARRQLIFSKASVLLSYYERESKHMAEEVAYTKHKTPEQYTHLWRAIFTALVNEMVFSNKNTVWRGGKKVPAYSKDMRAAVEHLIHIGHMGQSYKISKQGKVYDTYFATVKQPS